MNTINREKYTAPSMKAIVLNSQRVICDSGSTSNYTYEDTENGTNPWF